MASDMSKEDREAMQEIVNTAEPYDEDDPILETLDSGADFERLLATIAKKLLDGKI